MGKVEKLEKKKKSFSFMKNVLMLMFSEVIVKLLGLVYRLVITNAEGFGDTGLGYYSSGYQIYALLLTICSVGIPSVVSKFVSERLAVGDKYGAQRVFKIALKFFASLGLILSLALFFGADFIATNILNVPDVSYVLKVLSPAIVFVATSAIFRGYFNGQNNMKPSSIAYTVEQFFNCVLTITFVYALIGQDSYIMAAGANLSTTLSVIITFIYFSLYYRKHKIETDKSEAKNSIDYGKSSKAILKKILAFSIPVTIGSIISVVTFTIDTATVSNCIQIAYSETVESKEELEELAMEKSGILSKVDTLVNLPVAINLAFSTALVPAISQSIAQKDKQTASKRLTFSVFASIVIVVPCALGFISLAEPILQLIYPSASEGANILRIASVTMILVAINQTMNGGLYGLGKARTPAIALAVGATVKLILNMILISNPNINIYGASIGSLVCQIINFAICFTVLNKSIKLKLKPSNIIKPLLSGVIMGVSVFGINMLLDNYINSSISTLISIACGALIYVVAILLLKTLTKEDILMIPYGSKLYDVLVKMKIYKEERI